MADIFVSYTSSDRDWAFWIGQVLEKLGHRAHLHDWEISAGGDIAAWMEERHDHADHILCDISKGYLTKPYSRWERLAAQWAAAGERPNFVLPILIEECELRTLLAHIKRCDLYGIDDEDVARTRLAEYLAPAAKPAGPVQFPPKAKATKAPSSSEAVPFPGGKFALSNIAVSVPRHFLGRDQELAAIDAALKGGDNRVAVAALYGLRGVGKTTLAAAYAQRRKADYRATWWIRAQTPDAMRADLISLGVRLGWVAADEKEEPALETVRERLRDDGEPRPPASGPGRPRRRAAALRAGAHDLREGARPRRGASALLPGRQLLLAALQRPVPGLHELLKRGQRQHEQRQNDLKGTP